MVPADGFKEGQGLECKKKVEGIGLVQPGKEEVGVICNYLKGSSRDAARYFLASSADATRNNGHKPAEIQPRHLHL